MAIREIRLKAAGLCYRCGLSAPGSGMLSCRACGDKYRANSKARAARLIAAHVCYVCGRRPPEAKRKGGTGPHPGGRRCRECMDRYDGKARLPHGLTVRDTRALRVSIGACQVPGCSSTRRLTVDHDHVTRGVRGVVCGKHNTGIGQLGDSFSGVYAALEYLAASELPSLVEMLNARAA